MSLHVFYNTPYNAIKVLLPFHLNSPSFFYNVYNNAVPLFFYRVVFISVLIRFLALTPFTTYYQAHSAQFQQAGCNAVYGQVTIRG